MRLILASGSPRRKELLSILGYDYEVLVSDCEEVVTSSNPGEVTKELALQKAQAVAKNLSGEYVVIGADTVVAKEGKILGKPKDKEEAREMITLLSGSSHEVYTGVSLIVHKEGECHEVLFAERTQVNVDEMTKVEIEEYINTEEPYDKAGGYGIQGIFGKHIAGIQGDYQNVVGLPLHSLYKELKKVL